MLLGSATPRKLGQGALSCLAAMGKEGGCRRAVPDIMVGLVESHKQVQVAPGAAMSHICELFGPNQSVRVPVATCGPVTRRRALAYRTV